MPFSETSVGVLGSSKPKALVKVAVFGIHENRVEQSGGRETLGNGSSWRACEANGVANLFSHTTIRHRIVEIHVCVFKVVF